MWKDIISKLSAKKIIAIFSVIAIIALAAVAIPLLSDQGDIPVENPVVEQPADEPSDNQDDSQEETEQPGESEEPPASDDEPEEEPNEETDSEKDEDKGFWDKVVDVITGNGKDEDKDDDGVNVEVVIPGGSGSSKPGKTYNVSFFTDGGTEFADKKVAPGTEIDSFPTPYKANSIFEGWYYDEEGTLPVASTDTVEKNLDLYASYIEMSPLEAIESKQFASAIDVESNFRITVVTEDKDIDAETVLAGIEAKNLSNPDQKDFIRVTGGNGTFMISGTHLSKPGFEQGASFRITLKDGRLNFKDEPESVREYNFTTFKEEVSNLRYNEDITYIPASDLSEITINGEGVESLNIPLYTMSTEGETDLAKLDKGTFKYSKGELEIGEIVTVYKGVRPDLRTFDTPYEECGEVAYIEITGRNGDKYSYQKAESEDILFEPDMLPIPADADTDEDENSVTVENKYLDYSADAYANIELDSLTTVDPGDFLVFYTGNFGIESGENAAKLTGVYGEVINVTDNGDGTTTIVYSKTNWDDVVSAMDVYTTDTLSGDYLLEGVDVEALESEIAQQAIDSGFAEEAAQYLASLALATDNFTKLSENMNLEDYKVELSDGTPISPEELQLMDSSVKAEFELEKMKPTVGIRPSHLDKYNGKGLVVGLEMEGTLTLSKQGTDNTIEITISGEFLEELSIDVGASHKAIWDNWGPFPYISEYRVTANIDLRNFTGLEVNATMVTKEADDEEEEEDGGDDEEGDDITGFIKDLLEKITEEGEEEEEEEEDEDGSNLVKHYSEMLEEEADFLKIVDAQMFEKKIYCSPEIPIICIEFQADFIIEMEACVSIGFDFEYQTGKRYVFTIDVFDMKAYSDTITLVEETYEFCFYAMGRLGVRAGIELTFKVGLFDTSTNSVGLQAGAGAYTKLWGYFYYELTYSESQGKDQNYNGALLIEVGAFLELGINAQVLEGALSKDWEILDKEWPLWHVGEPDNILDFTTAQEDMPNIKLKQYIRNATLPDTAFMLHYLDLQEGEEMDAVYEDYYDASKPASKKNRNNFTIKFTNNKFSYDPQTNAVVVTPAEGDEELYGEMIITWNHYPLAFSSKPIQRTVSLYWDNYRSGYVIVPYTGGGTYIPIIVAEAKEPIETPADPEKLGYIFDGWYLDEEYTESYTFPEIMPGEDAYIYAKWEPRTDIPYRVEHYQQQLASGNYEIFETEEFTGTTNTYVTPAVKNYVGYDSPAAQELKVLADGSAVIRYYYDLQWASVTFNPGEIGGEAITHELKYGARISAPQMAEKGYTFLGWDKEVVSTMGTEDVTYTAQWAKNPDTEYRIEYYVQQVDGRYTLQHLIEAECFTGDTFTAEELRGLVVDEENDLTADEKFIIENAFEFDNMTVKGVSCETAEVAGNGKTIIKINYKRAVHTVTFDFGFDEKTVSNEICYEGAISVPAAERAGYDFKGWSLDGETVVIPEEKVGLEDLTYTAVWEAHTYTVKFDKNSESATGTMEDIVLTYDKEQALSKNGFERENYVFAGWGTHSDGAVDYADGEKVLNLTAENSAVITLYAHWNPEVFNITYHGCENAVNANPATYTVESDTITLSEPVKEGYIFKGWYANASYSGIRITAIEKGSSGNLDLYAKWEARTDIPYRVEHYQETAEGDWALIETENLTGSIDAPIYPAVKSYEHYDTPAEQGVYIALDGTTVVRYEYTRKYYTITLDVNGGIIPEGTDLTITAKHGTPISLPAPQREGFGFDGWFSGSVKFSEKVMPTRDMTLVARYTAGQFGYTVNHYQQNVDGIGYTLLESVTGTAPMDSEFIGEIKEYTGFTSPSEVKTVVIGTNEAENAIDYCYTRNQYNLTWNLGGGTASGYTEGRVYYGTAIVAPSPVRKGYSYAWDKAIESVMPAYDLEYTAIWSANSYSVVFDLDGGKVVSGSAETKTATFGSAYGELPVLEKQGYSFDGWYTAKEGGKLVTAETLVSIAENHTLYARFSAVTYTITYKGVEGATNDNPDSYSVKTGNITLKAPVKEGFTFEGWYLTEDFSGEQINTIAKDRAEDLVLYAKWNENSYTVIFHSNNGTGETTTQEVFAYTEEKALDANIFVREGYNFLGWAKDKAATVAEYTDGQIVSKLSAKANDEVHLYAVWAIQEYNIIYENMEGAENASDNPTKFSAENNVITLHEPSKKGYTFEGWFTDPTFEHEVSGTITLEASHDWIFYAKWSVNQYVITFDSCLGESVPKDSMLMTYDVAANLTLISEMNFSNPGYTFKGWATEKGGEVVYTDGQNVINLVEEGGITLYAVWELNVFTITYDIGVGGVSHNNPSSYSYEDDDIIIEAPVAIEGFQFLGWYEGDTKVTEIVKGTQRDFNLVARWAHEGIFSLELTGSEPMEDGIKRIFTVKRTIPEGAVAISNPQHVYYRTLNFTAYGSTVDVVQGEQHDDYHFLHVGGPQVYLVFSPNDTEMTFSVTEWGNATMGHLAAGFRTEYAEDRSYFVELYKVDDTVGEYDGTIDRDAKRTQVFLEDLPDGEGFINSSTFEWKVQTLLSGEATITAAGYSSNPQYTGYPDLPTGTYLDKYIEEVSYGAYLTFTMDVKEVDEGWQYARIWSVSDDDYTNIGAYKFEIWHNKLETDWQTMHLPSDWGDQAENIEFAEVSNSWDLIGFGNNPYKDFVVAGKIDPSLGYNIDFDASGTGSDDWKIRNLQMHYCYCSPLKIEQIGIAPLADGIYKAGDVVYITVIYSDVIDTAKAGIFSIEGLPVEINGLKNCVSEVVNDTLTLYVGTNTLVFEAVFTEDFEVTPDVNNMLVNTKPAEGKVYNVSGLEGK